MNTHASLRARRRACAFRAAAPTVRLAVALAAPLALALALAPACAPPGAADGPPFSDVAPCYPFCGFDAWPADAVDAAPDVLRPDTRPDVPTDSDAPAGPDTGCLALDPQADLPPTGSERALDTDFFLIEPCDHAAWAKALRVRVRALLEPYPSHEAAPRVLSRRLIDNDTLVREELEFTTADGLTAFAVVLRPNDLLRRAAILVMHPHDVDSSNVTEPQPKYGAGLSFELSKRGFVTLSPDIRSFGRFKPRGLAHWGANGYAAYVRDQGDVFARLAINDARTALRVLRGRDDVDAARLGMAGLSVGAFITLVTAVVETDIQAAVVSGLLLPFDILFTSRHHFCQHLVELQDLVFIHELAAGVFPRALQVHWGADCVFYVPHEGTRATAALAELSARLGFGDGTHPLCDDPLTIRVTPGLDHSFHPATQAAFFEARFGPPALEERPPLH